MINLEEIRLYLSCLNGDRPFNFWFKIFYKDDTETKVKIEVRFDISVQRQKFLSDSVTIAEEFEKSVRINKIHWLLNFKWLCNVILVIKFVECFWISLLKYCIPSWMLSTRRKMLMDSIWWKFYPFSKQRKLFIIQRTITYQKNIQIKI